MGVYGYYEGHVEIPEEKKGIFAKQVEKLLYYGGMMKIEEVSMYGQSVGLLSPLVIYPSGKVEFHFNYFEDDAWESAGFYADKSSFFSNKIGSAEFCDVITAIHFLYEMNDTNCGYVTVDGEIENYRGCVGWINHVLGTQYSMSNRFRLWEYAEYYAFNREQYSEPFNENILESIIPRGMIYEAAGIELTDLLYIINGTKTLDDNEKIAIDSYPMDILKCKVVLEKFFKKDESEQAVENLVELLKMDRVYREKVQEEDLIHIVEMTLFLPARVFAYLVAEIKGIDFWEFWKEIHAEVYHDEVMKKYASDELIEKRLRERNKPIPPVSTSEYLRQDGFFTFYDTPKELKGKPNYYISDDDRMFWWDGTDEVKITDETQNWLVTLASQHKELMEKQEIKEKTEDFFNVFLSLLVEINRYYKRIYPFRDMFYEFIQNGEKIEYKAAVELLRKLSEENKDDGKVIEKVGYAWDLASKNVTHNIGRLRLKRYLSVMANKSLRKRVFGF